jgi:SAM-dependent methyltransferase
VTLAEAVRFIRDAVEPGPYRWADLGAGPGVFTEALAHLLGAAGEVVAVDRDPSAIRALEALAARLPAGTAAVRVVAADLRDLSSVPGLAGVTLDGALLGNVLHFFPDPSRLLTETVARLTTNGRVVVVEYGDAKPNRWVPHPVPFPRLRELASEEGLALRVIGERPSRYQRGALYCAVLERADPAERASPR